MSRRMTPSRTRRSRHPPQHACLSVSNNDSVTRPLPSLLPGSDGTPSPAFQRYYVAAKTTVVAHPRLRFSGVAQGGLELTSLVRSPGPGSPRPKRLGVVDRCHPAPVLVPRRPTVLPGSQRTPLYLCPALRSRPDLGAWLICGAPVLPPRTPGRRLQQQISFRDSITRLWHWLSTLRAALAGDYARLASGGG
jgi:hypothetical protein